MRSDLLASLAVVVGSVLWGLYWLPVRLLGAHGLAGAWPGLALFVICVALLAPLAILRRARLRRAGLALVVTGLATGAAFGLYSAALLLTEVVRVLLLFYLTPVWSTLLGALLLGERIAPNRWAALLLGIAGLLVVLGVDQGVPLPRNLGDWLALLAGMSWAYGSLRLFRERMTLAFEQSFGFLAGAALASVVLLVLPLAALGAAPEPGALAGGLPVLALAALALVLPATFFTIAGARVLSPGRVGILLMGEAVTGIVSAALLTDEPFGLREALGSALVIGAALVEVLPQAGVPKHPRP